MARSGAPNLFKPESDDGKNETLNQQAAKGQTLISAKVNLSNNGANNSPATRVKP